MRNFIRTLAVCIAVISTSIPIMAQQISIVSGKVLNLPEGEKRQYASLHSTQWHRRAMP